MKRLLLLLPLLLTPTAQAVDYVKCEAMQKAASRVSASMDWRDPYQALLKAKQMAECGSSWDYETYAEYQVCADPIFSAHHDVATKQAWIDEYQAPMKARLAKIKADYQAEGCY